MLDDVGRLTSSRPENPCVVGSIPTLATFGKFLRVTEHSNAATEEHFKSGHVVGCVSMDRRRGDTQALREFC